MTSKRADPFALARTRMPLDVARTAITSPVAIRATSRAVCPSERFIPRSRR